MKVLLLAGLCMTIGVASMQASVLAEWNFSGLPASYEEINNLPATDLDNLLHEIPILQIKNTSDSPLFSFIDPAGIWAIVTLGHLTLSEAITVERYIEFTLEPQNGFALSVDSLLLSIIALNPGNFISLFSSVDGFELDDVIDTQAVDAGDSSNPQEIVFSVNQVDILDPVTFRIYPHGFGSNVFRLGDSGDPSVSGVTVTGTVPEMNTASLAFATLSVLWLSSIGLSRRRIDRKRIKNF